MACESCDELQLATGASGEDGRGYNATSVTSLTIATVVAATTFSAIISLNKAYSAGTRYRFSETADPKSNYFEGVVYTYNPATGAITGNVDNYLGSGTISAWSVNVAGDKGATGANGTPVLYEATLTMTNAQVLTLNSTPIAIKAAVTGELYEVIAANVILTGGSATAYATNTILQVITDSSATAQFELDCLGTAIGTNPSYKMTAIVPVAGNFQCIQSKAILAKVKTGDPTAGADRTVKVIILYRILT